MSRVQENFPITPDEFERAEQGESAMIPRLLVRVRQLAKQNLRYRLIQTIRDLADTPEEEQPTEYASFAVWHAVQTGPKAMSTRTATELDALAYEAGVWCLFDNVDPDNECRFVPLDEWESMYREWCKTNA